MPTARTRLGGDHVAKISSDNHSWTLDAHGPLLDLERFRPDLKYFDDPQRWYPAAVDWRIAVLWPWRVIVSTVSVKDKGGPCQMRRPTTGKRGAPSCGLRLATTNAAVLLPSAADCGEYRQAAGAIAEGIANRTHIRACESLSGKPVEQQWKTCCSRQNCRDVLFIWSRAEERGVCRPVDTALSFKSFRAILGRAFF